MPMKILNFKLLASDVTHYGQLFEVLHVSCRLYTIYFCCTGAYMERFLVRSKFLSKLFQDVILLLEDLYVILL